MVPRRSFDRYGAALDILGRAGKPGAYGDEDNERPAPEHEQYAVRSGQQNIRYYGSYDYQAYEPDFHSRLMNDPE